MNKESARVLPETPDPTARGFVQRILDRIQAFDGATKARESAMDLRIQERRAELDTRVELGAQMRRAMIIEVLQPERAKELYSAKAEYHDHRVKTLGSYVTNLEAKRSPIARARKWLGSKLLNRHSKIADTARAKLAD